MRFENLATRLFFGAAVAALLAVSAPGSVSASAGSDLSVESLGCGGPGHPVCATTVEGKTTYYDYYN